MGNKRNPAVHLKGEYGIAFGILVNIWVVVWCCLDSFVVCGTSFSPGDLVYDSLEVTWASLVKTSGPLRDLRGCTSGSNKSQKRRMSQGRIQPILFMIWCRIRLSRFRTTWPCFS